VNSSQDLITGKGVIFKAKLFKKDREWGRLGKWLRW
jgi:hypothetical protein